MTAVVLLLLVALVESSFAVFPPYFPAINQNVDRDDLIVQYFNLGINYKEILAFLVLRHGFQLSLRQLKRVLRERALGRRRNSSNLIDVVNAIEHELTGSGSNLGYRSMSQRLASEYGLSVHKETVRHLLQILDPEGVMRRSRHRLQRRQYRARGPNFIWHIDGYDKLKPFGFCIHGAIDGYSRRLMWLEVGPSNNNPSIVAQYFIDCVRQVGGTPMIIRGDCGTENVNTAAIQRFLRANSDDSFAGERSFMYGKSVSNQRIEAWWGILRKGCSDWWINYFKDMRDSGLYDDSDHLHVECLKFSYYPVLKEELHKTARLWNLHKIRPSSNEESPSGRPDVLYHLPEISGTRNYNTEVDLDDLEIAEDMFCSVSPDAGCDLRFKELASIVMAEQNLHMPTSHQEARELYLRILASLEVHH